MRRIYILLFLLCGFVFILQAKTRKAVYIIIDGVPADQIERLRTPAIFDIAAKGAYGRAYTGGEVGGYSETPTISAPGYNNLLTSTWANKHNVRGNSNLKPNFNYWSIFRIAKEQDKNYKTAIYSSWTDNRTVLLGEGKKETNYLKIDYIKDGYDLDKVRFPSKPNDMHIFEIDELVSLEAAEGIRKDAPDFSWVYLWYTDDAGHIYGNSADFDEFVVKADIQVGRIWEAVKYREANFDEEWMIIVTTDHGRGDSGYGHGGQSLRERTTWISTNVKVNEYFGSKHLSIIDIAPSICRHIGFSVPKPVLWEQDGIPFIGPVDICDLKSSQTNENSVSLSWKSFSNDAPVTIYAACDNKFMEGEEDVWIKLGTVRSGLEAYTVDLNALPQSRFSKFVLETANNHINRWQVLKAYGNKSSVSIETNLFHKSEGVNVTFKNAPVGTNAWVGIYKIGDKPGSGAGTAQATAFKYTTVSTGTLSFNNIPTGKYFVVLFGDGGYDEISPRKEIEMIDSPIVELKTDKQVYTFGEKIEFEYSGGPGNKNDWIGIYALGKKIPGNTSDAFDYVGQGGGALSNGIMSFPHTSTSSKRELPVGGYFAAFFENDGYQELSKRIYFIIGQPPTLKTDKEEYNVGEYQNFLMLNMPGFPSSWLIVKNNGGEVIEKVPLDLETSITTEYSLVFRDKYPPNKYTATIQLPNVIAPLTDIIPFSVRNTTGTTAQFNMEIGFCYPNPVTDFVYFPIDGISEVKVYSQVGLLMMVSNKLENRMNLTQLPPGIYLLVVNSYGNEYRFKVIKN